MKNLYFLFFLSILTGIFPGQGNAQQESFLSDQPSFSVIIDKKDASSADAKDGSIHVKVEGGEAPYTISVYSTAVPFKNTKANELKLKDLPVGEYLIIVQDKSLVIEKKSIEISIRK